jgi:hypothetical protein
MPTNLYFSPAVRTEQFLYQDLIIEGLRLYGQETFYIPRTAITSDEILNEDYSRFESAYMIEMYVANTEGFEGEGTLLSKFGLEIRDQATFILARRRFDQLVSIDDNKVASERPREGDLIYLPLANSLFEIKFVEHEKPFYRLSDLPIYELQCELFEYTSEKFDTGVFGVDQFETQFASRTVIEIQNGQSGFYEGEKIFQVVQQEQSDQEEIVLRAEVSRFNQTEEEIPELNVVNRADLHLVDVVSSDGKLRTPSSEYGTLIREDDDTSSGWTVSKVYDLNDSEDLYIPSDQDDYADNTNLEIDADSIIDFSTTNPFGEPTTTTTQQD